MVSVERRAHLATWGHGISWADEPALGCLARRWSDMLCLSRSKISDVEMSQSGATERDTRLSEHTSLARLGRECLSMCSTRPFIQFIACGERLWIFVFHAQLLCNGCADSALHRSVHLRQVHKRPGRRMSMRSCPEDTVVRNPCASVELPVVSDLVG